jgi:hypothetical protein
MIHSGSLSYIDLVELPQVDDVGLQAFQAVFEVLAGALGVAGTVLGHEEDFLALAVHRQGLAHDGLAAAVVIIPGVIEEGHALVDGSVHDLDRFLLVLDAADVPAAQAEDGDLDAGLAQRPRRQSFAVVRRGGNGTDAECRGAGQSGVEEIAASSFELVHGRIPFVVYLGCARQMTFSVRVSFPERKWPAFSRFSLAKWQKAKKRLRMPRL